MKRNLLFMSVLASLFIAGCSQEEITPKGEDNGNGEVSTNYMAVNLVSSNVTGTRADEEVYEDGNENENNVTRVRFYFFNGVGGTASVKLNGSTYVNYYDWENPDQKDDENKKDDVEKILQATIVINTQKGDKLPQMIAAVLNPPTKDGKIQWGEDSKTLTQLQEVVDDYATNNLTQKGNFVMFNSVYENGGTEICAVPITTDNLQTTEEAAKKAPVTIHVERSVAKVKVSFGTDVSNAINSKLALKDKDGNNLTVGGEQVYLKFNNWSLTANTNQGRLVKRINPKWQNSWWKGSYRTFWAINSMEATNQYNDYGNINASLSDALYTNENAHKDDIDATKGKAQNNTKVILKGTLCKSNDDPFTIVRHLGAYFADTYSKDDPSSNLPALKANILTQLRTNGHNYYYETTEGEGDNQKKVRKQIDTNDLKIVIATQKEEEESDNNCYVYAQLTDAAQEKTWYDTLDEGTEETPVTSIDYNTINKDLANDEIVDKALVWNSGMTYYYYEIKHLKNDQNQDMIGVVRNHIYDTKVTKITGLGTPVYDPDQKIYPEKPSKNDHFIAAEINILSWRIVPNEYTLDW